MNRVKDNRTTEYVVPPEDPGLHIEGYGLLYEGRPLLVEDESIAEGTYLDHYVLNTGSGMPYLVDLHTIRYYLATYNLKGRRWSEEYAPQDCYNLLIKATPCHMMVSIEVGNTFSLRVTTKPLAVPIVPYKVLPSDCLDNTESGPTKGTIIKILKYIPDNLGGEYIGDRGFTLDTYIGAADSTKYPQYHIFRRERRFPEFYESLDMTTILALQRGLRE